MRKQTKLVAVLSAAALLAIGASMTSFAAWQKSDDGTWQYFDRDGEMVAGEWQKDGSKFFYLDDDGNMLTDSWVDDEYYVGDDGAMLVNTWKKTLADEDVNDPDEDSEGWYYFGSKGKITKDTKKIGGKTYYFDDNGKMEDGWIDYKDNFFYLGEEDDGARKSGWLWLEVPDVDGKTILDHNADDSDDVCDEEGWYYFGTDGKAYQGKDKKKINGKYYFFNEHGQMLYEWINGQKFQGTPAYAIKDGELPASEANANMADSMIYANVAEEGWRADGWYEIDGAEDTNAGSDTDWYFFKDGAAKKASMDTQKDNDAFTWVTKKDDTPVTKFRAKIKVNGKYFCFNEIGQMETGLQFVPATNGFYYFDENGYMKTGKISSVEEDNDSFTYFFDTKQGKLGKGFTGEKSGYLYWNGKRLEADDDYRIYNVEGKNYLVNSSGKLQKSDGKDYFVENKGAEADMEFDFNSKSYEIEDVISNNIEVSEGEIWLYDTAKPATPATFSTETAADTE